MREVVGSIPTATTISNLHCFARPALMNGAPLLHAGFAFSAAGRGTDYACLVVEALAGAKVSKEKVVSD